MHADDMTVQNVEPEHLSHMTQYRTGSYAACSQGFYVNVDYHSNLFTDEVAHGDGSIYNQDTWISTWVQLLEAILQSVPAAAGRLLIDLVNEPDG